MTQKATDILSSDKLTTL